MKHKNILLFLLLISLGANAQLRISPDSLHLQTLSGKPFFWLGDTAWELFHRLNREEADMYLTDRAKKGFTVIQAVVLAELDGIRVPNPYGDKPLLDTISLKPNEAYFKHVDYIVNKAEKLGLIIAMLPSWGDKWNKAWGVGPVIFNPENAASFGEFLGKRYKNKPIVWVLGGDRNLEDGRMAGVCDEIPEIITMINNAIQWCSRIQGHHQGSRLHHRDNFVRDPADGNIGNSKNDHVGVRYYFVLYTGSNTPLFKVLNSLPADLEIVHIMPGIF